MVVVAALLNLMLLLFDILLGGHHLRLKLANLRILILGDYPGLFLLLLMALIVCLITFYEIMFRPSLLNLMPSLCLLLPLSALLQLLSLVIVYHCLVLSCRLLWCGKVIFIIYCISVCLDWCFCIHFANCINMPVSACFLFHHCLSHLSV